jgi:hypothetical protein
VVRRLDAEAARCLHDFVAGWAHRITATEAASANGLSRRGCFNSRRALLSCCAEGEHFKGSAQHLYENGYCQRGQMENLIKLHKAQLASDRMSCHSATANQVRLAGRS